jgi:hypothetical protein
MHRYNWHRPHGSLKSNPPISRLGLSEDNLLRLHVRGGAAHETPYRLLTRRSDDEGENDRRMTTSDTKIRPLNQALSVR